MPAKPCELDTLPSLLLMKALPQLLLRITELIHMSVDQGFSVDKWKTVIIRPLLKKTGLELIMANYWQVSNLSLLSKPWGNVFCSSRHCYKYDPMSEYQSSYGKHHSFAITLVKITNDIMWSVTKTLTGISLSVAFDNMDQEILLDVLHK